MAKAADLVDEIFRDYDYYQTGELTAEVLQVLYGDIRVGSLSVPQIRAAIKYACVGDTCEKSELIDLLREMDRRYFLIQDFRWEFSMLDTTRTNTITEEQTRWFVQMVYKDYFSNRRWEIFLRNRAVPGSGVTFAEIEVMLCNIPSKQQYYEDLEADRREREEWERNQREIARRLEEERRRKQQQRDEERRRQEEEERRRQKELERRKREEENERLKKQNEKEEYERRRKQMEEDEERGRREAEIREMEERKRKEKEEKDRLDKELMEAKRLRELQERQRQEEEERRRREMEEALDLEALYQEAKRKEKEAEDEAEDHLKRQKQAKDEASKKDAQESERRARLRARDWGNKKMRYALKIGIKKRDRELLVPAVDNFKKAKLPDDDMDLPKAEKILREFQARDGLKLAIKSRQISALEKAINYVKIHGFEMLLTHELIEANKILLQLRRLERIRAEILELKQSTVAEIRSYQKPPRVVHVVMTGTFLLLGHKEKETREWKTVQALVGKTGKDGLKRRCLGLEPHMMDINAAKRAKVLMADFDLDDVRDVSAGAATFYVWSWTMIEELEAQIEAKMEEEKKKEEEKKEEEEKKAKKDEDGDKEDQAARGEASPNSTDKQDGDP